MVGFFMSSYVFKDVERKNRIEAKDAPLDRTLRYYCPGCDKAHMHIRSYDGLRRKYFAPYFGHGHELGCPFSTTKNYDCAKFVVSRANFEKWLRALTKPIKETATNETVLTFKKNNGVSKSSGTLRVMYFELKYLNPEEYYGSLKVKEIFVSKKHLSKNKKDIEGWKIVEGQRVAQAYWFNNIPKENVDLLLEKSAVLLKENNMAVDINTGTYYRYPIKEITPYKDFMKFVKKYDIPIIFSSDAHQPEHSGFMIKEAAEYAKNMGLKKFIRFDKRRRIEENIE